MANRTITMQQLSQYAQKLAAGEVVLDVRSREEFAEAHVPGAINIPHDEVDSHLEKLRSYKTVYLHCQAGGRAGRATQKLSELGLTNIVCISGSGMGDWLAAGLPVAKGSK
jgi:rhodanese-related sulfurtransferase